MNKKMLFFISLIISLCPLLITYILVGDKKFWSYSFGLLLGAYGGMFLVVIGLIVIYKKTKLLLGIFGIIMGSLILLAMVMSFYDFYHDIPYYKNQDFEITEGRVKIEEDWGRGGCTQEIHINGLELSNLSPIDEEKYYGERLKIYFLPHTKLVMKIKEP